MRQRKRAQVGTVEPREAARLIGISQAEMDYLIRWGEVLTCRLGRHRLIPLSEVELARSRRRAAGTR